MARVGLTEAAKLTGKAPSTITRRSNHRDPKKRLGFSRNDDGEKVYDVGELERVFGRLQVPDERPNDNTSARTGTNANQSNDLQQELNAALEAQNTLLHQQIALLQKQLGTTREDLEHWRDMAQSQTRMLEDHRSRAAERLKKKRENQQDADASPPQQTKPAKNSPEKHGKTPKWFLAWLGTGK